MSIMLEAMFGEETFDTGHAKVQLFAVPSAIYNKFDREFFIDQAARDSKTSVRRISMEGPFSSRSDQYAFRDDVGQWRRAIYELPEGMLIKVYAHKTPPFGGRVIKTTFILRMRANAAYRQLDVALTGHQKARFTTAVLKGRFDILPLAEAKRRGYSPNPAFEQMFNEAEMNRIVSVSEIEPEIEAEARVRDRTLKRSDGKTLTVQTVKTRRTIQLDD